MYFFFITAPSPLSLSCTPSPPCSSQILYLLASPRSPFLKFCYVAAVSPFVFISTVWQEVFNLCASVLCNVLVIGLFMRQLFKHIKVPSSITTPVHWALSITKTISSPLGVCKTGSQFGLKIPVLLKDTWLGFEYQLELITHFWIFSLFLLSCS